MNINQQQAIASNPEYSVYISASAGSGKTKVLIDRILRLMLADVPISNILCVTFTNAAADEMLERLKEKTKKWLYADDQYVKNDLSILNQQDPSAALLARAKTLFYILIRDQNKIKIQTIHAFCASILNISIDNYQCERRIISNAEKHDILQLSFINTLQNKDIYIEVELLSTLYSHTTMLSHVKDLFSRYTKAVEYIESFEHKPSEFNLEQMLQSFDCKILSLIAIKINNEFMWQWLDGDLDHKIQHFDEYAQIFLTNDYKKRVRITGAAALRDQSSLIAHQNDIYDLVQKRQEAVSATHHHAFVIFAKAMLAEYMRHKKERALLDYDELLSEAIAALSVSDQRYWLLWRLDCAIDHILIDEAQDLNAYQWRIINLLTEEFFAGEGARDINRTIFIVGDIKQAIFGFQGAEPAIFQYMCEYYREKVGFAQKKWIELNFNTSFRSGVNILDFVDRVFTQKQSLQNYTHHISARGTQSLTEIWPAVEGELIIEQTTGWQLPQETESDIKEAKLGRFIAGKIQEWVISSRKIMGSDKIITPGDIMIIVRKRGKIHDQIIANLQHLQISVTANGGVQLIDSIVIKDILSAAKFAIDQHDNFNLVLLLKSYFFNFTEEQIFQLVHGVAQNELWNKIEQYSDIKLKLMNLIESKSTNTVYAFFYHLIIDHPDVSRHYIEISRFFEAIIEFITVYEQGTLEQFLHWFNVSAFKLHTAHVQANSVVITTAHSAKGLQAPIVILADASESENMAYDNIYWYGDEQLVFSSGAIYETQFIRDVKEWNREEMRLESDRLLYVALTRAEDELYIAGLHNNRKESWYSTVNF